MMEFRLLSTRLDLFHHSLVQSRGVEFGLARASSQNQLAILAPAGWMAEYSFEGESSDYEDQTLLICPLSPGNAAALRKYLRWLNPQLIGLNTSAGMGDRLGIATPGHVRAVRQTGNKVAPIFAQQSIREMQRTRRSPQQVMDDAMWGIFEEGWQAGAGADADHLKTTQDIDACLAAGFTLFTIDPSQYVNNQVVGVSKSRLHAMQHQLSSQLFNSSKELVGKVFEFEGQRISLDEAAVLSAILKYGRAIEHIVAMYRHLEQEANGRPFEVEISMDETNQPTSPAEHVYIAKELQQQGVRWISFAPRLVGRFEKGVDYLGDLNEFEAHLRAHAAIARQFGPYKLSLHSGSDKFSLYPIFMEQTRGLAHLKTAGTSYLEALRTIAIVDAELMKNIYQFAREHFEADRTSYHVSAQLNRAPHPDEVQDWEALFEQFDARQILHVTFGSVLTEKASDGSWLFYDRILDLLGQHRELYFDHLEKHFQRHLRPFSVHGKTIGGSTYANEFTPGAV
jgi:hypothetical protein